MPAGPVMVAATLPARFLGSSLSGSQLPMGMNRGRLSASFSALAARVTVPEWQESDISTMRTPDLRVRNRLRISSSVSASPFVCRS